MICYVMQTWYSDKVYVIQRICMQKNQIIGRVTIHLFICGDILSNGRFYHRHRKIFPGNLIFYSTRLIKGKSILHTSNFITIIQFDPSTQEKKKKKIQCTLHLFSKVSYCTKPYLAIMKTFGFSYTRRLTDWNIMVNSLTTIMSIISFVIPLYRQMVLNLSLVVKYLHSAYC